MVEGGIPSKSLAEHADGQGAASGPIVVAFGGDDGAAQVTGVAGGNRYLSFFPQLFIVALTAVGHDFGIHVEQTAVGVEQRLLGRHQLVANLYLSRSGHTFEYIRRDRPPSRLPVNASTRDHSDVDVEQTAVGVQQRLLGCHKLIAEVDLFQNGRLLSRRPARSRSHNTNKQRCHQQDADQSGLHGQNDSKPVYRTTDPPATVMHSPVMNEASSESRKAITAAVSSGSCKRPRAIFDRTHWSRSPPDWATV